MAKKHRAALRALQRRYKGQLSDIRREYEAEATALTRANRELESDYRVLARQFRREISVLKKKKLLPKGVDVRKAVPTPALGRALNRLYDVVIGRRTARKVSVPVAKKLKSEGFQVEQGRVILDPKYAIKKGGVVRRDDGKAITIIQFGKNFEKQIDKLFAGLGPGQYVGIDLGNNFSELKNRQEKQDFISYINQYNRSMSNKGMKYVTIVHVAYEDALAYEQARSRQMQARRDADKSLASERRSYKAGVWIKPRGPIRDGSLPEAGLRVSRSVLNEPPRKRKRDNFKARMGRSRSQGRKK